MSPGLLAGLVALIPRSIEHRLVVTESDRQGQRVYQQIRLRRFCPPHLNLPSPARGVPRHKMQEVGKGLVELRSYQSEQQKYPSHHHFRWSLRNCRTHPRQIPPPAVLLEARHLQIRVAV